MAVMAPVRSLLASLIFLFSWTGSNAACFVFFAISVITNAHSFSDDCAHSGSETTRVRKPWHSLSDEVQMLYVNGFQTLHRESILIDFLSAHDKATSADQFDVHETSQNFYWHSYFLWELENSFRALGGDYECFTLPYWDVTHDEAAWSAMDLPKSIDDLPIYNAHLGGNGNISNDYCVGDPWTLEQYVTDVCPL